jgi:pilus assembly protein Flp/PilA
MNMISRFMNDESGATAIEYGLIAALIGVALITVLGQVGSTLSTTFGKVKTGLEGATSGSGT